MFKRIKRNEKKISLMGILFLILWSDAFSQVIPADYLEKPLYSVHRNKDFDGKVFKNENITFIKKNFDEKQYEYLINKIGWVYHPNSINRQIVSIENTNQKFDVIYYLDEFGRRTNLPTSTDYNSHLILAGDSNTFGIGLNQNETLAYYAGKNLKRVHVYNYGHGGGGPHNTLAFLSFFDWSNHIKEKEGKMLYLFYPEWMAQRVVGARSYILWDLAKSPWYALNSKNQLEYKGSFKDRWIITGFYKLVSKLDFFNIIGELPRLNQRHMQLTAKIFKEMEKEYLNKFPKGQFIVALSGYLLNKAEYITDLAKFLTEEKVKYSIITPPNKLKNEKYHLIDSHFNFEGVKFIYQEMEKAQLFK